MGLMDLDGTVEKAAKAANELIEKATRDAEKIIGKAVREADEIVEKAGRVAEKVAKEVDEVVGRADRVVSEIVAKVDKLAEKITVPVGAMIGTTVGAVAGFEFGPIGLVAGTTGGAIGGVAVGAVVLMLMQVAISNASEREGGDGSGNGAGGQRGTNGGGAERIRRQAPAQEAEDIPRDQHHQQKEKVCAKCDRHFRTPCLRCDPGGATCYKSDHCSHMPSMSEMQSLHAVMMPRIFSLLLQRLKDDSDGE